MKNFLDLNELSSEDLRSILQEAKTLKKDLKAGKELPALAKNKCLGLLFEKPSTRTRVSFEVGIQQLGGSAVVLEKNTAQFGKGETIADTAKVLSGYLDLLMLRTDKHEKLLELAAHASIPIINGLTDYSHPCQIMADLLTFEEQRGEIAGAKVVWCGDGNNVATSYIHAAIRFGFDLVLSCPQAFSANPSVIAWAQDEQSKGKTKGSLSLIGDPKTAVKEADLIVTDTWVSMGDQNRALREQALKPYQVTSELMALAQKEALFMHCLPAYREQEVTTDVIDGPQSVVWAEAENRLHAQKTIMTWCLS